MAFTVNYEIKLGWATAVTEELEHFSDPSEKVEVQR